MDPSNLSATGELATELHALLRETDPIRCEEHTAARAGRRLARIRGRVEQLLAARAGTKRTAIEESLVKVATVVREHAVDAGEPAGGGSFAALRRRLVPAYEHLAAQLRARALEVPTLRPTNWPRIVFHVSSALGAILLFELVLGVEGSIWATGAFAAMCWVLETGRALSQRMNDALMRFSFFQLIIHPHEHYRVNSATWYATALVVLAVFAPPIAAVTGVAVLGLGDPAAGLAGRRWGRRALAGGRTLEGSIAFVLAATLGALAVLGVFHAVAPLPLLLAVAGAAAIAGALAELVSRRVDDNFLVPVAAGAAAWLTAAAVGLPL